MKPAFCLLALITALPAAAETTRQLGAHEHGVGTLDIAVDGATVAMALTAPGADIVGFEYATRSAEDRAAIDAALATLSAPLDLFALPAAAGCTVSEAQATLEGDDHGDHDDHEDHEDHEGHDDHDGHEDHEGHEDHADHEDQKDHDAHEDHADHADHEDHADASGHTEFHATYTLTCTAPEAIDTVTFPYFDRFPNARELTVQVLTPAGARAASVARADPTLALGG